MGGQRQGGRPGGYGSASAANRSRFGVRWTIGKSGANYKLDPNDTFEVHVRDDLSGLEEFRIMAQGY